MSKQVLIVSYHFYPDPAVGAKRPTQLAKAMKEKGWGVDVITKYIGRAAKETRSNDDSAGKIYSIYQHPGVINPLWAMIKRIRSDKKNTHQSHEGTGTEQALEPESKETIKYKLKRYIISMQATLNASKSWVLVSMLFLLFLKAKGRKYDVVLTSSPLSSSHLIGLTAKSLFNAKWIADIRDPINMWDEVLPVCKSKLRAEIETYLERKYYQKADEIVVTSPSLKEELCASESIDNRKIHLIYNGYDGDLKPRRAKTSDITRMVYAGALYFNRSPFPVFEAIKELATEGVIDKNSFIFDLFGDCETWKDVDLVGWVKDNGIDDIINFHGSVSLKELDPHLQDAEILLNLAQGQRKQIPAKTFEYLKFNAIQFLVSEPDSDISKFLSDNNFGVIAEGCKEDVKEKLIAIITAIGDEGTLLDSLDIGSKEVYARRNQNKNYMAVIDHAVCRG